MEKAIKIKPEWERIKIQHLNKCSLIQSVVEILTNSGLTVTHGDIVDLMNNGRAIYDQIEQTVKSNAGIFKLPAARSKFIEENTEALRNTVEEAKNELYRILAIGSMNPLTIEAYDIKKGVVSLSDAWVEQLKESHTIWSTEERENALELIHNAEAAIKQLNDFVKDNRHFGSGITSSEDPRRSLAYISGDGVFHIDHDALEFI